MIDSQILGDRLKQIRSLMGITQKQLAVFTGMTQSAISRLEKGEEVYASVLMSVLHYYHGKVSLDNLFASEFSAEEERMRCRSHEEDRKSILRQLDIIADILNEANDTCLAHIAKMKQKVT